MFLDKIITDYRGRINQILMYNKPEQVPIVKYLMFSKNNHSVQTLKKYSIGNNRQIFF
jgi:hypothetical protein